MIKHQYFSFVYFYHCPYKRRHLWINLACTVRMAELICCGPFFRLKSTKQILMSLVERAGIVGTYSSGVKMTLKVKITPMETTLCCKNFWILFVQIILPILLKPEANLTTCFVFLEFLLINPITDIYMKLSNNLM